MRTKIEVKKGEVFTVPYSSGIMAENLVFVSGQIALKDGKMVEGTITEQMHQVMMNLKAVLEAAGSSFGDVVKATVYVTDMSIGPDVNAVYRSYLVEPFPAREMVCVKELPLGAKVEISMIAVKSK